MQSSLYSSFLVKTPFVLYNSFFIFVYFHFNPVFIFSCLILIFIVKTLIALICDPVVCLLLIFSHLLYAAEDRMSAPLCRWRWNISSFMPLKMEYQLFHAAENDMSVPSYRWRFNVNSFALLKMECQLLHAAEDGMSAPSCRWRLNVISFMPLKLEYQLPHAAEDGMSAP